MESFGINVVFFRNWPTVVDRTVRQNGEGGGDVWGERGGGSSRSRGLVTSFRYSTLCTEHEAYASVAAHIEMDAEDFETLTPATWI
jgi:hypothetical protein